MRTKPLVRDRSRPARHIDDPVPIRATSTWTRACEGKKMAELLLDPDIRMWVILPIVLITLMFGLLRHYITVLLTNDSKEPSKDQVRDT